MCCLKNEYCKTLCCHCESFVELTFAVDYDLGWRIKLLDYKIVNSSKSVCYHYGSYSVKILFGHVEQYCQTCKERIYVLAKNYSFSRLSLRLSISIILMLLASSVWSLRTGKNYMTSVPKAVYWNLLTLESLF